jgi:tetratricopeptide (TPR) repeat protein
MKKSFASLAILVLLGGCQSITSAPETTPPAQASAPEPQQYASFSQETLYALLTAELAGQRGRFDIALGNYLQQANATEDPAVAERAYRIAEYLGSEQAALLSSQIWADAAPDNLDAQRAAAIQLARAGRFDESLIYMENVLKRHGSTHFDFLALSAAETDPDTRSGLMQNFDRLLQQYPNNAQLLFGQALLLQQDGRPEEALALLQRQPVQDSEIATLLLRTRLLQSVGRGNEALPLLEKGIRQHPDDKRLRLAQARLFVDQERIKDAKQAFSRLLEQYPDDDDLRFSLALVCMEAQDWQEARTHLQQLVRNETHVNAAHLHLGRVHEELGEPEQALDEYSQVGPSNEFLPAQVRQSNILFSSQRSAEASRRLSGARLDQPDYALQLYLIESEAWAKHQQPERASRLIEHALKEYPDDLSLLYTRAMLAEKRGDLVQLEQDLRFILEREPDNAMALNALGYTLADRTTRYAEAKVLIEQAHQLNPQDPAIMDSLGWVQFRLGNLSEAERLLRQAHERFPDPEVAAHLGEVLWARGKHAEARKVWAAALKEQPDSSILRSTLQRLTGSEKP